MKKTIQMKATMQRTRGPQISGIQAEISKKKSIIQSIKCKHAERILQADQEFQESDIVRFSKNVQITQKATQSQLQPQSKARAVSLNISGKKPRQSPSKHQPAAFKTKRNVGVTDTDRMIFDKKFKNYLNHREQFQRKARERRQKILRLRKAKQQGDIGLDQNDFIDKEQLMSDDGNENQYQNADDMQAAYDEIVMGKRKKKNGVLYHAQKFEYQFRKYEFDYLSLVEASVRRQLAAQMDPENQDIQSFIGKISKSTLQDHLFDWPCLMMLYSINPYQLADQLAEFQTQDAQGNMTFEEFSHFLLTDREPTYFQYTRQNLQEARNLGRGIKCLPIIGKWIADEEILEWLFEIFTEVDFLGQSNVERAFLAKKIRRQAKKKRILHLDVVQIVNINKLVPLSRMLYELEFGLLESDRISFQSFKNFFQNYKRIPTPFKDKLLMKLILSGKYDPSYVYIIGNQTLELLKETYSSMQKFAQFFVVKEKFVEKLVKNPKFKNIRKNEVRSEGNRYVKKQNVEQTLERFMDQGEYYVDLEEILDFFTNRGRPEKTQYQIYLMNLQIQLDRIDQEQRLRAEKKLSQGDISTSSDEEDFQNQIRRKKLQRKKNKLAAIRNSENYGNGKKFDVTVPFPFSFGAGTKDKKKISIRQQKVKEMIQQKLRLEDQSMEPFRAKQVPAHVKENLFEKIMKDQERDRQQRLQKFRLQSIEKMRPLPEHLTRGRNTDEVHCEGGAGIVLDHNQFRAKPLPWYCEVNLMDRINRQKQERRERILQECINRHSQYDLPDGAKKMMKRQEQAQQRKKARSTNSGALTASTGQFSFIPRITDGVPDFKTIHQHLHIDLENIKQTKPKVALKPFSFQNRQSRSKTAVQSKPPQKKKQNLAHSRVTHQQSNIEEDINIPITLKFSALVELRKKQEEERLKKQEKEVKDNAIRKMRHQKFAPYVREVLRKNQQQTSKSRVRIEDRLREFKKEERRKKAEHEEQMINIYTKVFNRPLLIESSGAYGQNEIKRQGFSLDQQQEGKYPMQQLRNQPTDGMQRYAEDYEMVYQENANDRPQQYSKRHNAAEYEEMRRKAVDHPPKNYVMDENVNGAQGQYYEQGQQYEDYEDGEGQYLSENGRYTN